MYFPANQNIKAKEIYVVSPEGEGIGKLSREDALAKAKEYDLDLILVNPRADPPVALIKDLQKFIYDKKKQQQKSQSKSKGGEQKQLRFGANIAPHDLQVRIKRAREFIEEGNNVKLTVQYGGREIIHKEVGREKIDQVIDELNEIAQLDKEPWFEGNRLIAILRPR